MEKLTSKRQNPLVRDIMTNINFPMIYVSDEKWDTEKDYDSIVLYDKYIHSTDEEYFKNDFYNNSFVDCDGVVFKVVDRQFPSRMRQILRFIPTVCKVEIIFEKTGKRMTVEEVRSKILSRLEKLDLDESLNDWIMSVKNAKTIKGIIVDKDD